MRLNFLSFFFYFSANIQDVLSAASHTQIIPVVEACSEFLQGQLDLENCVDIVTIADTYSLTYLQRIVYQFMCDNLDKLSWMPEFQRLRASELSHLLESNYPIDCPEVEVVKIVLLWVLQDKEKNIAQAGQLLEHIHFDSIGRAELEEVLSYPIMEEILCQNPVRQDELSGIRRKYKEELSLSRQGSCLVNPRGFEQALVTVGGFLTNSGVTNSVTYYHPSEGTWRHLTRIPHIEQCNYGASVLNNELFVVGGCMNQSLQEDIHPFGFKYEPRHDRWKSIAPMNQGRCRFYMGAANGKLYSIGGVGELDNNLVETSPCECYDPVSDRWSPIESVPGSHVQHAGATYNDLVFISGGLDFDTVLDTLWCYDTNANQWCQKCTMLTPRTDHCMVAHGNKLFVAGGWFEDANTGQRRLVDSVDTYNIATDQWEELTHLPAPRYHVGMAIMSGRLYVIGGCTNSHFDGRTDVIEGYDLEKGQWQTLESYPTEIWEHLSCTLYIPTCKESKKVLIEAESN